MTNEVVTTTLAQPLPSNPFAKSGLPDHVNAGTIAIEAERAIAEAQGKLVVAKRFPRDPFAAMQAILDACKRPGLAKAAIYSYPRGGQQVSGPSIRLAEELARCWGNVDYGLRELSNRDGVSEMEAYAWDLETNTISSQRFTVRHVRDKRNSTEELKDQRDIYEITANMGARRMRARILAIIPDDVVDAALNEIRKTLAGGNGEPLVDRINRMVAAFDRFGVKVQHLEQYLGKSLKDVLPDDIVTLQGVFNGLKDGTYKPSDYFGTATRSPQGDGAGAALKPPANDNQPSPERAALEKRANELGVEFRANIKDETLAQRIKEAEDAIALASKSSGGSAQQSAPQVVQPAQQQKPAAAATNDDDGDLF